MNENQTSPPNAGDVTLDLREELSRAPEPWEPLFKILRTASQLRIGQSLKLVVPFEPVLLRAVMTAQGFTHHTSRTPAGDWEVVFQGKEELLAEGEPASAASRASERPIELDFRGAKETPPLAKIIEAQLQLPGKPNVVLHTDERPDAETLPEHCRCMVVQSEPEPDGTFKTCIQMRDERQRR